MRMITLKTMAVLAAMALFGGCADNEGKTTYIFPQAPETGQTTDDPDDPVNPGGGEDPGNTDDPGDDPEKAKVPCFIWIDAAANSRDFFVEKSRIERDLKLAADAGFTHIIVDVRPTSGDVLYKSSHCQEVEFMGAWVTGGYKKFPWNKDFDYLQEFIDRGHELGLKVYAGFNTMVAGIINGYLGKMGVCFRDPDLMNEVTWLNTSEGMVPTSQTSESEYFFNPASEVAQTYIINLLKDLAAYGKTGLDGIILDRGRFKGYQSDFSPSTREKFEEYVGAKVVWPDQVLPAGWKWGSGTGVPNPVPMYYKKWNEFRAKIIHDFMTAAHDAIKAVDSNVDFGVYVGAWYGSYYENGVNWASPRYNTSSSYPSWATSDYKNYGFADLCDVLLLGAYAGVGSVYGTSEWTMQGFCRLGKDKTKGDPGILAGGPDVGNWSTEGYTKAQEYAAVENSVSACVGACGAYFLFDMIHLKLEPEKWNYVKKGIAKANETYGQ